jgi:hypothetical protein
MFAVTKRVISNFSLNLLGRTMPTFSIGQRLKIALGGFITFIGMVVLVCAILTLTGAANLTLVFQGALSVFVAAIVGALDVACGLLLVLRNREIVLSLASHQEKTSNNTD